MSHYREKVNEKCEVLNPTGYCCRELVDEVVSDIKKEVTVNMGESHGLQ